MIENKTIRSIKLQIDILNYVLFHQDMENATTVFNITRHFYPNQLEKNLGKTKEWARIKRCCSTLKHRGVLVWKPKGRVHTRSHYEVDNESLLRWCRIVDVFLVGLHEDLVNILCECGGE